jgi:hypothetical protein
MNAEKLPPIRKQEVQAQILKVKKLSRFGRGCCSALIFLGVLASALFILTLFWLTGAFRNVLGTFEVNLNQASLSTKVTLLAIWIVGAAIIFNGLFRLRALFNSFAVGAIYTNDNVGHIRRLGLLALLWATLDFLKPVFASLLVAIGAFDKAMIQSGPGLIPRGNEWLSMFVTAGLILLASWIMDVGKETNDEAEQMRKEAELVV